MNCWYQKASGDPYMKVSLHSVLI